MDKNNEIIIYTTEDGVSKVDVAFDGDTVWLSLDQMAELFQRDKSTVSRHIKNIFSESELKILNNLVSGYFDLAEINAIEHKPMYMTDYVEQLDAVLTSGNRKLLQGSGTVSHMQALTKAKSEYRKYQEKTLSPVEEAYISTIKSLEKKAKKKM